jgi:RNA polymerase-interacting CarD/CdnL/TRCF family regulator
VEGIIADADDLEPGDRVVYPNQGVCRVTGIEKKEIAGQKLELVRMEREEDGAAVLVPRAKVPTVGLRKVASRGQIEGVFHYLAASFDDPELDWKVRHRDNADRLIAGGVLGVAEVVKGLHSLSRIRPLPAKEREQYDNARHLLVHEIAVSLAVPPALAEDYIDFALIPPEGVKFELKPPPKPVELPVRPRRRIAKPVAEEETEDDLGLGELGIELGPELDLGSPLPSDLASVLPDVPEVPAGDEAVAGLGDEEEEPEGEEAGEEEAAAEEELPAPRPAAKVKAGARAAPAAAKKRAPAKAAPRAAAVRKGAEKEPAGKKAAKPAPKPAVKPPIKAALKATAKAAVAAVKAAARGKPAPAKKKAAAKPAPKKSAARGGKKK